MKINSLIIGHFGRKLSPISAMKGMSNKIMWVDKDKICAKVEMLRKLWLFS